MDYLFRYSELNLVDILGVCRAVNLFAVKWYGESEFWLAMGKVILILGLIAFTFITMLGGNPKGDRYGFRYWRDPVITCFQQLLVSLLAEKANSRHRDHLRKQLKRAILESSSDFLLA